MTTATRQLDPETNDPTAAEVGFEATREFFSDLLERLDEDEIANVMDNLGSDLGVTDPNTLPAALAYRYTEPDSGGLGGHSLQHMIWDAALPQAAFRYVADLRHAMGAGQFGKGHCRDCGRLILWARTHKGNPIPLDLRLRSFHDDGRYLADYRDNGDGFRLDDGTVVVHHVGEEEPEPQEDDEMEQMYFLRCHLASCPEGDDE